ncbi:protein LYRIC [Spea bombifrons]|uniref:protein LYRIC n=1 Tax=Spea bombifrons TaxID=233779 RepID=UPI00234BA026|nr:protein LYRIC [Spea bombifrons]
MASGWQEVASQQAEEVSVRLRQLLIKGLGLLHSELGLDLGLQPQRYPSWVFLAVPASLGLLLLLLLLWATSRGSSEKKRTQEEREPVLAEPKVPVPAKNGKGEEPKKKNKKKPSEKAKPNGRPVELIEEEVITAVKKDTVKQPLDADKKNEKIKKNKKKLKSDSKQSQTSPKVEKKEAEEGNWETKISNREKRQQRKRDKEADTDATSSVTEPILSVSSQLVGIRKTKGQSEVSALNGSSWNEKPGKPSPKLGEEKWASGKKKTEPCTWNQDAVDTNGKEWSAPWSEPLIFPTITAWSAVDGRINKTEPRPSAFSSIRISSVVSAAATDPVASPIVSDTQWDATPVEPSADDEWSGLNGLSSTDAGSDWNAPSEVWGNYAEEKQETAVQPEEPAAEAAKVSENENEKDETAAQSSAASKTKKKKKKKKKQEEESGTPAQDAEGIDGEIADIPKEIPAQVPAQPNKAVPPVVEKAAEPKKATEPKKASEPKKVTEPKKASEPKKVTEPKKAGEPKKVTEPKKASEPKKATEVKKTGELKKPEEEARALPVPAEPQISVITISEKSPPKVQQSQEKTPSIAKQNIVPPPSQGKPEENWESAKQVKKKKKARRET